MSARLDRTERRVIGVLIEKELSVPDLYPLTEQALLAGCNQKSNREPLMELRDFELQGVLMSLRIKEWVSKSERDGGRAVRYRHEAGQRLGVEAKEKAVLAELLLRGPQTPMELRARVGRMGFTGSVEDVHAVLEMLRSKPGDPLVELLPKAPRERDARWTHLLAPKDEAPLPAAVPGAGEVPAPAAVPAAAALPVARPTATAPAGNLAPGRDGGEGLTARVATLEGLLATLRDEVRRLERRIEAMSDRLAGGGEGQPAGGGQGTGGGPGAGAPGRVTG